MAGSTIAYKVLFFHISEKNPPFPFPPPTALPFPFFFFISAPFLLVFKIKLFIRYMLPQTFSIGNYFFQVFISFFVFVFPFSLTVFLIFYYFEHFFSII